MDLSVAYPIDGAGMTTEEREASQIGRCYVHIVAFQDVGLVW